MLCPLEIIGNYCSVVKFQKLGTEKVDLYTQVTPNVLKSFPITEPTIFKFKWKYACIILTKRSQTQKLL